MTWPSSVAVEKKPTPATPPTVAQKKVIAQTPVNKKLGLLTLNDRSFDLGYDGDGDGVTITATLAGTVSLNVGPMRFSVSGLGAKVNLHIPSDPLEDFDLRKDVDVDPATPTGLAVSVSGKVVEGGGFLQRIETPTGAVSWRGGLTLRLTKRVDVGAWAIIETGGGRHWSLLVFLVARFSPPLKLSTGWRLVSIGGMLGLHRTMNTDALRDAALGVGGNLDALFLPDRPEQRFLELMPVADRFFPAAEDHHVGGIMAVFEWGVTAKKTNARFRAALLLEIGNDQLALYGTAQLGFPTVDADQVVRIRAGFEALYDVERKFVRVSLTLTEATLFRRVHLTGGAALLIRWGDDDEFAFTLGGFHPAFRPYIPEGMREPPRLGAHWKPKSLLDLDMQAYFAFTSTSLQFGASAYLEAGASWGGVRGDIAFNMIVMSEPEVVLRDRPEFPRDGLPVRLRSHQRRLPRFHFGPGAVAPRSDGLLGSLRRRHLEGSRAVRVGRHGVGLEPDAGSAADPRRRSRGRGQPGRCGGRGGCACSCAKATKVRSIRATRSTCASRGCRSARTSKSMTAIR